LTLFFTFATLHRLKQSTFIHPFVDLEANFCTIFSIQTPNTNPKMPSKIQVAALVGAFASSVTAHGHLSKITVDGEAFTAYDPSFQYQTPAPEVIEWSCPECLDNGFVDPSLYTDVTK
jgi:hypothetical protein